jgi:hypothetical protein
LRKNFVEGFSLRDWGDVIGGFGLLVFVGIIDFLFVTDED